MAKTAYQIKKALGTTNGVRAKSKQTTDELKADIKAGKYNSSLSLVKANLENTIRFDTFSNDLSSMGKTIEDVHTNWQTAETMQNKRASIESMQERVSAYKEYQRLFGERGKGTSDIDNLQRSIRSSLDNWDNLAESYGKYENADAYNNENKKLKELYSMSSDEIKPYLNDKDNAVAYTTSDGYTIKWKDLYNDAYLREYEEKMEKTVNTVKYGNYSKKDVNYDFGFGSNIPVISDEYAHLYNYVNGDTDARSVGLIYNTEMGGTYDYLKNEHLTESEKKMFNAIYETQGGEKAAEYIDLLSNDLRQRRIEDEEQRFAKLAEDSPIFASIYSVANNITNNMSALPYMAIDYFEDYSIDTDSSLYTGRRTVETIRGTVENSIDSDIGQFFYRHGMNIADNVAQNAMSGGTKFGTFLMSSGAFVDTALDAKERGVSDEKALGLGLISGAAEYIFESKSFDALFDKKNLTRNGWKYFVNNMKTELVGELGTELTNDIADVFISQDLSKWKIEIDSYVAKGMSEKDAFNKVFKGALLRYGDVAAGTLLSTGVMAGTPVAIGSYQQHSYNTEMGENIRNNERIGDLFDISSNPEVASAYEAYTKYAKKGVTADNATNAQIGKLYTNAKMDAQEVLDSKESTSEQKAAAEKRIADLDVYAQYNPETRIDKETLKDYDAESIVSLIENGLESEEGTESHRLATEYKSKIEDYDRLAEIVKKKWSLKADESLTDDEAQILAMSNAKLSEKEISRLTEANDKAIKAEETTNVVSELVEIGESEEISKLIARKISGETLTSEESEKVAERVMENSEILSVMAEHTDGELAEMVRAMGKEKGGLFLATYDGKSDIEAYTNAFNIAVAKSENNFSFAELMKTKGVLSTEQIKKIYSDVRIKADNNQRAKFQKLSEETAKLKAYKGDIDDTAIDYDNTSKEGKVNWKDLTDRQRKAVTFVKGFAQATGINLKFMVNNPKHNGKYDKETNTITINLDEGGIDIINNLVETIIPTTSHELTHWMEKKAPVLYRRISSLVFSTLEKYDGISENDRIASEIKRLDEKGKFKESQDESTKIEIARSEIVARACEDMLSRSKVGREIFNSLNDSDKKTLTDKIKDIIQIFKDWVKETLGLYKAESYEASVLRKFQKEADRISRLWDEMLTESVEVNQALEKSNVFGNTVDSIGTRDLSDLSGAKDLDGNELFQYKAMVKDEATYRQMLIKHMDTIDITKKQINDLFTTIDKAVDIISNNLEALDYAWDVDINDRAFVPIKPNSDSLYKVSLDFSTLCRKRLLQQTIQQTLQNALEKNLSKEESIAIRDELIKIQEEGRKIEVACALCYVESTRMKSPKQINRFLNNREKFIREFFANRSEGDIKQKIADAEMNARMELKKANPDGFFGKKDVKLDPLTAAKSHMKKADADYIRAEGKKVKESYKLTDYEQSELDAAMEMSVDDFTSAKGLENLAKHHPELFDAYTSFVRNATHSKGIENDTWWRVGDAELIGDALIEQMNAENGLRSQSWSDFQVIHLLDYIAATIELSTKGAKRQSYTKVPDYVKLLGNTGDMINMSLIPERVFNGKLSYDGVEGMAYDIAKQLRDEYHKTVGTICIGINDEQIRLLLEDITIDMIIPYHHSSMSKVTRKLMHIPEWVTYESYQNEKNLSDTDALARAKEYGVELKKDDNYQKAPKFSEWFDINEARQIAKLENSNPSNKDAYKKYGKMYGGYMAMQKAASNYLKLCAERGLAPKFSHENADFTHDDNYWKLLIDRKMVDNITGEIIEQNAIKPIFNEQHVLEILNDELERYPQVKADQEYAARKVTEKFLSGEMNVDKSTLDAIKKPVDNITNVNILESSKDNNELHSDKDSEGNDTEDSGKLFSYDELNKKGNLKGIVIYKNTQVKLSSNGNIDADWVVKVVKAKCKILKPNPSTTTYYTSVPDIGKNVEIIKKGITHGFMKSLMDKSKPSSPKDIINARVSLELPEILKNSIEVNRSSRAGNIDIPYSHIMIGTVGLEDANGNIEYYAVRSVIEERINQNPILAEAEVLGKLHAINAKKIGTPHVQVTKNGVALARSVAYTYKISQFLEDVKTEFNDTFSNDVYQKLAMNRKVNDFSKDLLFSDKEQSVYDLMGEKERLLKENEKFKAEIERLNERLKIERQVTHGNYFNEKQLGSVAGHLRSISNSQMDKVELMKSLKDVYSFIAHSNELTWEEVFGRCYNVAQTMLADVKPEVMVDDYSKQILKDIRSKQISLSKAQKSEAKYIFGKNWNRNFFGKTTIADSGIPLESQWQEWSESYPNLFRSEISDTDMVNELYDIIGSLQSASETVMEYNTVEQTRWLANEIYNQYWNVSPIRTTADKYDKKIKLLNFEHRRAMSEIRNDYKTRLKSQHKADMEKQKKLVADIRERKDKQIVAAKEHGREMLTKYKDNAERKTRIQRITANALTLKTWLEKNSKEYHIHDAMKGPVIKLLQAIDFSSKKMLKEGLPTSKDISLAEAFSDVKSMLQDATNMVEGLEALYGHDLAEGIELLSEAAFKMVGDNTYTINEMTNEELMHLDKLVRHIKKVVTDLNKFHVLNHNQGAVNLANEFMAHGEKLGNIKNQYGVAGKFLKFRNRTPYYFFKDLGKVGKKLFEAFQDGWDKLAFNAKKVIDYAEETYTAAEVKKWSKETKEFTIVQFDGSERTFEMSIAQIMALHCVSKQEDAQTHLLSGGMTLKRIDKKGHVIADYENINLSISDIQNILGSLTDRQKEVADKLQEFMNTTCAKWGNEISMARFGIEQFGIKDYFPIKVSEATVPTDNSKDVDNASLFRLLNMSFTKARTKDASQSIEIGDIFDIFAQHSSDMAKYNALALPVLDFNKFYSIHGSDITGKEYGVVKTLKSVFGDEANGYIRRFVRDLNGSQNVSRDVVGNTFFKNAKVASVAANLRVVLLQPTAFFKASAVMDNKYLLKASAYMKYEPIGMYSRFKKAAAKAEKYCGIVQWKALGYYDTDISKGITEKIKHADTIKDKAIEKSMKGAEIADKATFSALWVACEFEVRDKHKDLKVGSEKYYNAVAERLREIIYATQVVDSTMTRSDMMRSPDNYDKMLTTFGSEPTIAYNMLLDVVTGFSRDKQEFGGKEAIKRNGKKIRKVVVAYTLTNAIAALVESGFDALRDDDDEEMDVETFMKLYLKNFAFDMSIGNKLPFIKEIYSIMQGYSSSRMDTQFFQSIQRAGNNIYKLYSGKGDWEKTVKSILKAMSDLSGLPFYNVVRDAMAILDKIGIMDEEE